MNEDHDFQERMARIETLIRQLERASDPAMRASIKELMQSVMDLHGVAVNRMLEIVYESGDLGARIIDSVGQDPLTGSLLILYGLHPLDLPARVARALEKLAPTFRRHGADVRLEGVEDGVVRLRIEGVHNAIAGRALAASIEEQIYAFAPDVTRVEGLSVLAGCPISSRSKTLRRLTEFTRPMDLAWPITLPALRSRKGAARGIHPPSQIMGSRQPWECNRRTPEATTRRTRFNRFASTFARRLRRSAATCARRPSRRLIFICSIPPAER